MAAYEIFETGRAPVMAWVKGVPVEEAARRQLENIARLPFVHSHVAAMPDVHLGRGATVGSVIATKGAIVPAAVGVDIGCGMMAMRTSLTAGQLPDSLAGVALRHRADCAPWRYRREGRLEGPVSRIPWASALCPRVSAARLDAIEAKHEKIAGANHVVHLGTLGTGNHFIEICLDEEERVWVMLHSGSRGIGNRIGSYFIAEAREALLRRDGAASVPDRDLAWFEEGEALFDDYVEAVLWAQDFARANREVMTERILRVLRDHLPAFRVEKEAVNCHHNYVAKERHFDAEVWVTRKGAVRAGDGELGIIPGSMGARSYIVRGLGNAESFQSCSHGAGRSMSRSEAKRRFSLADHITATEGVECRKDQGVIDETPAAYKDIDAVMAAQRDLVAVEHNLKQVVCVKG